MSVPAAGSPSSSRGEFPKSKPSMCSSRRSPASFAGPSVSASARASSISAQQRRSEEHTSELQSHVNLVCRLLLEKKKKKKKRKINKKNTFKKINNKLNT